MQWASSGVTSAWAKESVRLPVPWDALGAHVRPRGGQNVVLLAAPGVGKTTVSLNWAARANLRTLYCSADTDPETATEQLASLATGHLRTTVEDRLATSATWRSWYADAVRAKYPNLVMDYSGAPRLGVIAEKMEALTEVWGACPELLVLDTASDVQRDQPGFDGWQRQWLACREMARFFGCVIVHNHHIRSGAAATGRVKPSLDDGMYKPEQFAEMILGLYTPGAGELGIAVLKNRGGRSGFVVHLRTELERALVTT